MTAKDIITIPNPMLRERSQRVGHIDAEIRELTAPWLTQLDTMLRNMSQGRHVRQAYL